jgi:SAM-dependent methyltransferase
VELFLGTCVSQLPADEALRLLFDLDARLYEYLGAQAVAYGAGLHPKHRLTGYHEFFCRRIYATESVLDVGCGIGAVAHSIVVSSGATVTGIDLNGENIRRANESYRVPGLTFRQGNVLTDLPQAHFDVVVLSNVLEHLPDRAQFLAGLVAILTPKRILIRVPLFDRDWRVPLKRELGIEWRLDTTHQTEYTTESFVDEVRSAGLKVVSMEICWGEIWSELCP